MQRKFFLLLIVPALLPAISAQGIEIRNVTFQQRPGTKLVDIAYDLIGEATENVNRIEAKYSLHGGADGFPHRVLSVSGDIGLDVSPGLGKRIVWQAELDIPGVVVSNARVRVCVRDFVNIGGIATGVTRSDTDFDDGSYLQGQPQSFTDNGDGTITDTNTGLMWIMNPETTGVGGTYTWTNAISTCNSLFFAGYSDWRLPTITELSTLRNAGRIEPAIDPIFICKSYNYWSSSVHALVISYAWQVNFNDSRVGWHAKQSEYHIRPVRGGPYPSPRFSDHGNGTVTDNNTGLMWVKDPAAAGLGIPHTWINAISECENLTYAGYSDWRLPNGNELQSLVDYSRYTSSIDPIFICKSSSYWSSSVHANDTRNAWRLDFNYGSVLEDQKTYLCDMRPVRSIPNQGVCNDSTNGPLVTGAPIAMTPGQPIEESLRPLSIHPFVLDTTACNTIVLRLEAMTADGCVELYARRGAMPTRFRYDRFEPGRSSLAVQEMVLETGTGGPWYILVHAALLREETAPFTLLAECVDLHPISISPSRAGNAGPVHCNVQGTGFNASVQVSLIGPGGTTIQGENVFAGGRTSLDATFDLTGAAVGIYTLRVTRTSDGQTATLPDVFNVVQAEIGPHLEARIDTQDPVRLGRTYILWIEYANTGDTDMLAPIILLRSPSGTPMAYTQAGPYEMEPIWVVGTSISGPAGILPPGARFRIAVYFTATNPCQFDLFHVTGFDVSPEFAEFGGYHQALSRAATRISRRGKGVEYNWNILDAFVRAEARGEPMGAIAGTVRNDFTGRPLPGITVRAEGPIDGIDASDISGHYLIQSLVPGVYRMDVYNHTLTEETVVNLEAGLDVTGLDLFVRRGIATPTPSPTGTPTVPRATPTGTPSREMKVVINEIQPCLVTGIGEPLPFFVEIYNSGSVSRDLTGWILCRNIENERILLPSITLPIDSYLWIVFSTGEDDFDFSDRVGLYHTGILPWDLDWDSCELGLYSGEPMPETQVDYVAWGHEQGPRGPAYVHAVTAGLWTADDFVNTKEFGISGRMMRVPSGYDRNFSADWQERERVFQDTDPDNPIQVSPQSGTLHGKVTNLEWRLVDGAVDYLVEIDENEDFSSPAAAIVAEATGTEIDLPDGWYFWRVIPNLPGGPCPVSVWTFAQHGELEMYAKGFRSTMAGVFNKLSVQVRHQRKDTHMLCLADHNYHGEITRPGCMRTGGDLKSGPWDAPHPDCRKHLKYCDHCNAYCGRAVIQMINHYFGGSLTQDEISYYLFRKEPTLGPEGDLGHDMGFDSNLVKKGLAWAIGTDVQYYGRVYHDDPYIEWDTFTERIDEGHPIPVGNIQHAFIISGYYCSPQGQQFVHVTDTAEGDSQWYIYSTIKEDIIGYWTFSGTPAGIAGDPRIGYDSDGDGICDFDEEERFCSSPLNEDTDMDGIPDKEDIDAYTFVARGIEPWQDKWPHNMRPECNCDADGDGDYDGGEIIHYEDGVVIFNTDPYDDKSHSIDFGVEKQEYTVGDPVYIDPIRSGTLHANSTYHYEYGWGPECPNKREGDIIRHDGSFTTDSQGYAHREPINVGPEPTPGYHYIHVDILGDGVFGCGDNIILSSCWEFVTPTETQTGTPPSPTFTPPPTGTHLATHQPTSIRPIDPNEKAGPIGNGSPEFAIPVTQPLDYTIFFENLETSTAAATLVTITDDLSDQLDWTSFELTSFSWLDRIVPLEPGLNHAYTRQVVDLWTYSADEWVVSGTAYLDIQANINIRTGRAEWVWTCLDPETEDWPEDPYAGFLPPECPEGTECYGRGQGYVTFRINPRADLEPGYTVTNSASIVFETNAPIVTNTVLNTIIDAPPDAPKNPNPFDGSLWVSVNQVLDWDNAPGAASYDVYLWHLPTPKPAAPSATDLSFSHYRPPEGLVHGQDYRWQVVSKNIGNAVSGPEWSFRSADAPTATPTITPTPTATPIPRSIDADCDGFVSSQDLLPLIQGWHQSSEFQPYLDLFEDGFIDSLDLKQFSLTWNPPYIVYSAGVTVHPTTAEIFLVGELPGSNYCEIEPESVSVSIRYDEEDEVFELIAELRFGLEVCGCPPGDTREPGPYVPPEGEPVPFEISVPYGEPLAPGPYRIRVYANGASQSAIHEFEVNQ